MKRRLPFGYDAADLLVRFGTLPPISGGESNPADDDTEDDHEDDSETTGSSKDKKPPIGVSQADVDTIVRKRLSRERKKIEDDVRAQIAKDAETADATKRGDFDKVKRDYEDKIAELEKKAVKVDEYDELARARLKRAIKELPDFLQTMAPDEDDDPIEIERWLATKAGPALKKYRKEHPDDGDDKNEDTRGADHRDPPKEGKKTVSQSRVDEIVKQMEADGAYKPMF